MSMPPSSIRGHRLGAESDRLDLESLRAESLGQHCCDLRVVFDDQHPCRHLNLRWTIEPPCDSPGRRPSIADGDSAPVLTSTSVVVGIVAATALIVAIIGLIVVGGFGVVVVRDGRGVRSRCRFRWSCARAGSAGGDREAGRRRRRSRCRRRGGRRLGRGRGVGNRGRRCRCRRRRGGGCRGRRASRSERRGRPPSLPAGTDGSPSSIGSTGGGGSGTASVAARTNPPPPTATITSAAT